MKHIVIPDTQAKEGVPTDHLSWIGSFIVEEYHDEDIKIIHLGDHADMPSLSSYDRGTRAMEGRRYVEDIQAANKAWKVLNKPLVDFNKNRAKTKHVQWLPDRHLLLGNHENRINRAVESDAQLFGLLSTDQLDYARSGWKVHPFLNIVWLEGVGYSHYFTNSMGRPIAGQMDLRLKNIGHSFTQGHQQILAYSLRFVAGKSQHGLVAGSCYLHDEDYLGPQLYYWRGIIVCHQVEDGSYDPQFISLDYLCRRYEGTTLEKFMDKKYPGLRQWS